jgi:hypothetical protein
MNDRAIVAAQMNVAQMIVAPLYARHFFHWKLIYCALMYLYMDFSIIMQLVIVCSCLHEAHCARGIMLHSF